MSEYRVSAIFWKDHTHVTSSPLTKDLEGLQIPTLSFGAIIQDTPEFIIIASDIERYEDRDDITYTLIYKGTIVSIKDYDTICIENLKVS